MKIKSDENEYIKIKYDMDIVFDYIHSGNGNFDLFLNTKFNF